MCIILYTNNTNINFFSGAQPISGAKFGPGTGDIIFTEASCIGTEAEILQCYHNSLIESCSHDNDAGVICQSGGKINIMAQRTVEISIAFKTLYFVCIINSYCS